MQGLPLYANIEEVRRDALDCEACRRSETRSQVVFGAGPPDAKLMVIGEAPSGTDDRTGLPFTGPAGGVLDLVLERAGTARDEVWITNLVRCYAGRVRDGREENRPVRNDEIRACSVWLDLEIQYVDPLVILAVGAPATKVLISPQIKVSEQRGQAHTRPDGRTVIPTVQPAYLMRMRAHVDEDEYTQALDALVADITA
ncbi:MAG: uracil-DNA glycosylase, partial [Chloroflexota bacterium]